MINNLGLKIPCGAFICRSFGKMFSFGAPHRHPAPIWVKFRVDAFYTKSIVLVLGLLNSKFSVDIPFPLLQHSELQGVALTGRNRTGPPCSVGRPTAQAPGGRPAQRYRRPQTTTDASQQNNTGPLGGPVITRAQQMLK